MIKLIAENYIREDSIHIVRPMFEEMIESTRNEEGCVEYRLFIDEEDISHFIFIEEWESKEALDRHSNSDHFTRLIPKIKEYSSKEGKITFMREF